MVYSKIEGTIGVRRAVIVARLDGKGDVRKWIDIQTQTWRSDDSGRDLWTGNGDLTSVADVNFSDFWLTVERKWVMEKGQMSVWKGKGLSNREEKYGDSATHRFVIENWLW
jgi:hypothetical protein